MLHPESFCRPICDRRPCTCGDGRPPRPAPVPCCDSATQPSPCLDCGGAQRPTPFPCCDGAPQRPSPCECGCQHCCTCMHGCPHASLPPHGFLLPRIVASGRQWLQRSCLCLTIEDLPDCTTFPLTLVSVAACGACSWEPLPSESNRICQLRVTIPLCCQLQDQCGESFIGHATLTVNVPLRLSVSPAECWRNSMMVLPSVRLICAPCVSDCAEFSVQLEILVEAYMMRWEPCLSGTPRPVWPDLPLYPQPCFS